MFHEDLLTVQPGNPVKWSAYALATMLRCLHEDREELLQDWASATGGRTTIFLESNHPLVSAACVIKAEHSAIIAFEGTRNVSQILQEVFYAGQRFDSACARKCHSFFLWCLDRHYQEVVQRINDLPPDSNIHVIGHSLGGAMAHICAYRLKRDLGKNVTALTTFGQPRTFGFDPPFEETIPYVRWIMDTDPIPGVPPSVFAMTPAFPAISAVWTAMQYIHTSEAWIIRPNGLLEFRDNLFTNEFAPQILEWIIDPAAWDEVAQQNHVMHVYTDRIRNMVRSGPGVPDLDALHQLNGRLDRLDFNRPPVQPQGDGLGVGGVWGDPDAIFPTNGDLPTVPPAHQGQTFEQRGVAHVLFSFGVEAMPQHLFRGKDRRLLTTLKKVCLTIKARDTRTTNPKKSATLSNRVKMFPAVPINDVPTNPLDQIILTASTLLNS